MTVNRSRQTFPMSRIALVLGFSLILSTVAAPTGNCWRAGEVVVR